MRTCESCGWRYGGVAFKCKVFKKTKLVWLTEDGQCECYRTPRQVMGIERAIEEYDRDERNQVRREKRIKTVAS